MKKPIVIYSTFYLLLAVFALFSHNAFAENDVNDQNECKALDELLNGVKGDYPTPYCDDPKPADPHQMYVLPMPQQAPVNLPPVP